MPEEMMNQEVMEQEVSNTTEEQTNEQNQDYDNTYDYDDDNETLIFGMKPKTLAKFVAGGIAAGAAGKALVDKTVAKYKAKKAEKAPQAKVKKKWVFRSPIARETVCDVGGKEITPDPKPADPEQNPNQETANNEANS